jgi:hypothetical protein
VGNTVGPRSPSASNVCGGVRARQYQRGSPRDADSSLIASRLCSSASPARSLSGWKVRRQNGDFSEGLLWGAFVWRLRGLLRNEASTVIMLKRLMQRERTCKCLQSVFKTASAAGGKTTEPPPRQEDTLCGCVVERGVDILSAQGNGDNGFTRGHGAHGGRRNGRINHGPLGIHGRERRC